MSAGPSRPGSYYVMQPVSISTSQQYWMNDLRIYPTIWSNIMKNAISLAWRTKHHRNLLLGHRNRESNSDFSTFSKKSLNKMQHALEQEVLVSTGAVSIFNFSLHFGSAFWHPRAKNCVLCGWLQSMRPVIKSSAPKNLPLSIRDSLILWQRRSKSSSISRLTMEYAVSLKEQALCLRRWPEILQPELSIFYKIVNDTILVT